MSRSPLSPISGTLELLVLRTLGAGAELHGFAVLEWIREASEGELVVEDGALYHALHRMEKKGLLSSSWGISEKGRRAKYYTLTPAGEAARSAEEERWRGYVSAVARIAPHQGGGRG